MGKIRRYLGQQLLHSAAVEHPLCNLKIMMSLVRIHMGLFYSSFSDSRSSLYQYCVHIMSFEEGASLSVLGKAGTYLKWMP